MNDYALPNASMKSLDEGIEKGLSNNQEKKVKKEGKKGKEREGKGKGREREGRDKNERKVY